MSTYLIVNLAAVALPLALSFDRRVAFYKKWPAVFPAVAVVAAAYLVWDVIVTARGDWSFNEAHFGGAKVWGLPVEELLFFVTVPYACLFIYEVVRAYLPERAVAFPRLLAVGLAAVAVALALVFRERDYTFLVFLSVAVFFVLGAVAFPGLLRSLHFWLYLAISYVPFFAVNGVLTGIPVVIYNPAENLGIRVISIPLEDFFYSLSLLGLCGMAYAAFARIIPSRK
jgi:lycopene cyclase domain-containing protein